MLCCLESYIKFQKPLYLTGVYPNEMPTVEGTPAALVRGGRRPESYKRTFSILGNPKSYINLLTKELLL